MFNIFVLLADDNENLLPVNQISQNILMHANDISLQNTDNTVTQPVNSQIEYYYSSN